MQQVLFTHNDQVLINLQRRDTIHTSDTDIEEADQENSTSLIMKNMHNKTHKSVSFDWQKEKNQTNQIRKMIKEYGKEEKDHPLDKYQIRLL